MDIAITLKPVRGFLENSCAISHGLQGKTQQSLTGAGGLHPAEPFSRTFLPVDIKFKAGLGDLFCQMGWVAARRGGR